MDELQRVDVAGITLAYRVTGDRDAPPMVLLHAMPLTSESWGPVLPALAGTHRVYAPDLRGFGLSDYPGRYSLELMRDDVIGFLDALGIERCVLIGHSMGGSVAVLVAEAAPGRLTHLVLEDTTPPYRSRDKMPHRARPDRPLPYDFAVVNTLIDQINDPDPAWWDDTEHIRVPTLVIAGGPDSHVDQDRLGKLARRMPDARLVTIAAGHQVHEAQPDAFVAAVRRFLAA